MTEKHTYNLKESTLNKDLSINLPASKSIANRAIIVNALAGNHATLHNISTARDTELMQKLIRSSEDEINPKDAGTTMRFLTAYYVVSGQKKVLTGTERMQQRPIHVLVEALKRLGASIDYLGKEGYPPLRINGFKEQLISELEIDAQISSQYISALMMIAPKLPKGLRLILKGTIGSRPYIEMTKKVMEAFGAQVHFNGNIIEVPGTGYSGTDSYTIEPDWSAASYWYSLISLQDKGEVKLIGLTPKSIQGDHVIQEIMTHLGVESSFDSEGLLLRKSGKISSSFEYDFTDCPDLAQTVAVAAGFCKVKVSMTGLQSLRIKETDRITALKNELKKFNINFHEKEGFWIVENENKPWSSPVEIETYEDHRMAMAFMPACSMSSLIIKDPSVVSKSYPHFWEDVEKALRS